jgi:hypothetical protein
MNNTLTEDIQKARELLESGHGIYNPCGYCGEMTELCELYDFKIEDDENIKVCLKCESYLSDLADNAEDEETFEDTQNEALQSFNSGLIHELQFSNNW